MFQRSVLQEIKGRIFEPRKFIQVVVGPRQVGKTTVIKQVLQQIPMMYHYVTADDLYTADSSWIRRE